MSNPYSQAYENPQPNQTPFGKPSQTNSLGTAGFVVSLIGLFTCGLLSIFGLGMSLFGLAKNPKGLAIAGTVVGLVGLVELALMGVFAYNAVQAVGSMQAALYEGISESIANDIASDVAEEWELTEQLPSEAEGQRFVEGKTDLSEQGFRYETDGDSFTIRGPGVDQEYDTNDDIISGPFYSAQEVFDLVAEDEFDFDVDSGEDLEEEGSDLEEEIEDFGSAERTEREIFANKVNRAVTIGNICTTRVLA